MNPTPTISEAARRAAASKLFFVFDVESIGLHGEGYAVGWVVVGETGATYEESYLACLPGAANGTASSREWVDKNIPPIPVTHNTPRAVRDAFWPIWQLWRRSGAVLVADCCWPVEARFLAQCVDDNPNEREWEGPYPLHDVASVLLACGEDPLPTRERLHAELPVHHPLKDAKQSARILVETLKRMSALDSAHPAPKEGEKDPELTEDFHEVYKETVARGDTIRSLRSHLKTANELLGRLLNQADACAEFRKTFTPETREAARTHLNQQSK